MSFCQICSVEFTPEKHHPYQKYCLVHSYWIPVLPLPERPCVICSTKFVPHKYHPKRETCSEQCSRKLEYKKHKDYYCQYAKAWSKKYPEKTRLYIRTSERRNPAKYREIARINEQKRIARLRNAGGFGLSVKQWRSICVCQENRCYWCGEVKPLTIDHVIPITKKGFHDIENIVGACRLCNSKKGTKLWSRNRSVLFRDLVTSILFYQQKHLHDDKRLFLSQITREQEEIRQQYVA